MADPFFLTNDPHLAHHIHHAAKHVAHAAPVVKQGFSMLYSALAFIFGLAIGGGASWYVAKRGNQGVINDLNNAKSELSKLQAQATAAVDVAKAVV